MKLKRLHFAWIEFDTVIKKIAVCISYFSEELNQTVCPTIWLNSTRKNEQQVLIIQQIQQNPKNNKKFIEHYIKTKNDFYDSYSFFDMPEKDKIKLLNVTDWFEETFLTDENKLRVRIE